MIRTVIKLGLLLLVGILVYNYCFGDKAEKEQSKKIFGQVGSLVRSAADLVRDEKAKFDSGKYDAALDKMGDAYRALRSGAKRLDNSVEHRLTDLENRKASLEQQLDSIEQNEQPVATPAPKKPAKPDPKAQQKQAAKAAEQESRKERLQRELDALIHDTNKLIEENKQ